MWIKKPAEFSAQVEEVDRLISFDVKSGYNHFFLHPSIRNFFLFHWGSVLLVYCFAIFVVSSCFFGLSL